MRNFQDTFNVDSPWVIILSLNAKFEVNKMFLSNQR